MPPLRFATNGANRALGWCYPLTDGTIDRNSARTKMVNHFITRYALCLLLFNLTACASMQTVNVESAMQHSPPRGVDFGSLVVVRTLDGQKTKFRVTEITNEGIGGKPGFYPYSGMESLKVDRSESTQVNWGMVIGGILAVAAFVFLIDNADEVRLCSGVPCPGPEPVP